MVIRLGIVIRVVMVRWMEANKIDLVEGRLGGWSLDGKKTKMF